MVTGQAIIDGALTALGLLEQGGTPSVSDSQDSLNELNSMWDAWSIDEGMIYAVIAQRYAWAANIGFYTIGAGGSFNGQVPARIYRAAYVLVQGGAIQASAIDQPGLGYVAGDTGIIVGSQGTPATYTITTVNANGAVTALNIQPGTGYIPGYGHLTKTAGAQPGTGTGLTVDITSVTAGGDYRVPIVVVEAEEFYAHRDLMASALVPDELYPDYNPDASGFARLFLHPIPNGPGTLEMETGVPFTAWTLTAKYGIPPGMQDAIQYALAWRLIPRFGTAVSQQVAEVIRELGQKAEQRILAANAVNRQKPPAPPPPPPTQGGSPISTPALGAFQGIQPK